MDGPIIPKNPQNPANKPSPGFGSIRTFQQDLAQAQNKASTPLVPSVNPTLPQNNPTITISEPKEIVNQDFLPKIPPKPAISINPFAQSNKGFDVRPTPPPTPNQTDFKKTAVIQPIRTYNADIADAVKGGASLTSMAAAENDRRARNTALAEANPGLDGESRGKNLKNLLIIILSLGLLGGGVWGIYYIYSKFTQKPTAVIQEVPEIIPSESTVYLTSSTGNKEAQVTQIRAAIESAPIGLGSIEHLEIVSPGQSAPDSQKTPITLGEFLTSIESTAPDSLIRSLGSDFYFGVHAVHGTQPFLILKVDSFENALAGMLAWESTLIRDLQGIFLTADARVSPPFFTVGQTGKTYQFEDAIYQNKDLRLVKNPDGQPIFMYSFIDNNTLIITTDDFTLREVIDRLIKSRFVR